MLWQSIKQRNTACCVRIPVSDQSAWHWHQPPLIKRKQRLFCCRQRKVSLTYLISLQALITIPSCPRSSWLLAVSPQPTEEMGRLCLPLCCSCSFYPFLSCCCALGTWPALPLPCSGLLGWNQPSPLLLDRLVLFCTDPLHHFFTGPPFPWPLCVCLAL